MITSAGILLAAVFATLGVLPLVVLAQLGITVLVPALVQILGEKFWWPAHLKRAATNSASAQAATPRE
ncbi:hypothetical protein HMPREF3169_10395 [Corynebacterium sp. HMSC08C04]|nr:hypothetical protein HMPREF2724_03820 [Corynebacterium sp. HMSC071F07]OFT32374.1 hypothetical protein HMPREF3169_10395 [Corynebacterium sp. HMSC08C04]OFT48159.1 hypothetical protein HMPREF3158_02610 [Corynebacterium sp. HMSC06G04]